MMLSMRKTKFVRDRRDGERQPIAQLGLRAGSLEEGVDGEVRKRPLQPLRAEDVVRPVQSVEIHRVDATAGTDDPVLDAGTNEQNVARDLCAAADDRNGAAPS